MTTRGMTEDQLEQEALGWLADVGSQHRYGPALAPDGRTPWEPVAANPGQWRGPRNAKL